MNEKMELKKPYYMLNFRASACMFDIRVNDVPLFSLDVKGQTGTMIPINHLILNTGEYKLTVNIIPNKKETVFQKTTSFSSSIKLYDISEGFKLISEDHEYQTPQFKEDSLPLFNYSTIFNAKVPYRLNAWQTSKDLSKIEDLKSLVIDFFRVAEDMLKRKDFASFKNLIAQREQNFATSMYMEGNDSDRMQELINDMEKGYEINPISGTEIMFLYANGKLVTLKRTDGSPALQLKNKESGEVISLDLLLYIPGDELKLKVI